MTSGQSRSTARHRQRVEMNGRIGSRGRTLVANPQYLSFNTPGPRLGGDAIPRATSMLPLGRSAGSLTVCFGRC
jgi:hypothetical protein